MSLAPPTPAPPATAPPYGSSAPAPPSATFAHAGGLDGIRALAVAAVVTYHLATTGHPGTTATNPVLPGGFLGVDVFFVLSGYLITSLLITEFRRTRRISIGQFYLRRARRLLPALYAVLLAVGLVGAFGLPGAGRQLRGDLLAALGYATNWWLIAQHSSYFGAAGGAPDLLTHLWSLAVEEQYYLIWPLLLLGFAAVRAPRRVMLLVIGAGVVASTVAAALLYDPYGDPSRVYYGTDTRALAPLLGAFLAIAVQPWLHRRSLPALRRVALDLAGLAALAGLGAIAYLLHDTDPALYRGGLLVIAVLAATLVAVAGHPASLLGRALGTLRWLGDRSYAIYLWHWPLCLLVPGTGWPWYVRVGVIVGAVLALAEVSYWLVERPIRRYGFWGRATVNDRGASGRRRLPAVRAALLVTILLAGTAVVGVTLSGAAANAPVAGGPVDPGPAATLGPLPTATATPTPTPGPTLAPPPPRLGLPTGATVAFFGDSQGMTLLLNKPADLGRYIRTVDATIEGCGVLLGKVASRSGERRNLSANCPNWRPEWDQRVRRLHPDLAVIMIGAWDVFDLTLDSGTLSFGTPAWDANFTAQLDQGVQTLRAAHTPVAISLLPCYRPVRASAGFWPERGDDSRTRHVNDLLRAVAATHPEDVRTLEPPVQFCTDPTISRSLSYRWDGVHYYKPGAALYFKAVVPQLFEL